MDRDGFRPDSTTVSSIMINEIETTEMDILKREKDDLNFRITADHAEIEKVMKITAKYQENLEKQVAQELTAIEMLNLQEEELKSLHDESKGLAGDLNQERKLIVKDRADNKLKLQQLYQFDVKMQIVKETIEKRESQLEELASEKELFTGKLDQARGKIDKALKVVTVKPRTYKAMKGDSVDEMLANVLNIKNCEIPISRLSEGWYMFGSKKIYTKIMNNKLVCRVGGGFMNMDEFIATYAESERLKLERMDPNDVEALHSNGTDRHTIKAVPLSTRNGARSPKAGSGNSVYLGSPKGLRRNNSGGALKKV